MESEMKSERERLIGLVKDCLVKNIDKSCALAENIAEDLLANGVIVPPVKVGQTVWRVDYGIECVAVDKVVIKHGGIYMKLSCNSMYETSCRSVGKTVFLTQEEAEIELERRKNETN